MQAARAKSEEMSAVQLRTALEEAAKQAAEQAKYFDELVEENSQRSSLFPEPWAKRWRLKRSNLAQRITS
jgi:hypothetical protein